VFASCGDEPTVPTDVGPAAHSISAISLDDCPSCTVVMMSADFANAWGEAWYRCTTNPDCGDYAGVILSASLYPVRGCFYTPDGTACGYATGNSMWVAQTGRTELQMMTTIAHEAVHLATGVPSDSAGHAFVAQELSRCLFPGF
jgi:hypothetical protein